jgi:hypothetical protein
MYESVRYIRFFEDDCRQGTATSASNPALVIAECALKTNADLSPIVTGWRSTNMASRQLSCFFLRTRVAAEKL